jgi:DNA polymerase-1
MGRQSGKEARRQTSSPASGAKSAAAAHARRRRLFLLDGSSLVFRAHFAFIHRPLTTSRGLQVGALFGFTSTLLALIRNEQAQFLAVAFDTAAPTFRHERYELYKANRPEMPEELAEQMPYAHRLVEAMGLKSFAQEGLEADDLIGSLTRLAREQGWDVVIVSADKDFAQLIRPGVRQYVPSRGREPERWVDAAAIEERWGVRPDQFIDFLALMGDSSDNIPGVAGVGPKTAAVLLGRHDTLAGIYENLDSIMPPAVRKKLTAGRENAFLSRELVEIRTDSLGADLQALEVPDPASRGAFRELLEELEFDQLARRIFPSASGAQVSFLEDLPAAETPGDREIAGKSGGPSGAESGEIRIGDSWAQHYRRVESIAELAEVLRAYDPQAGPLAIDTETSGLDPRRAELVGLSFAWRPGEAWYVPLGHSGGHNLARDEVRELLGPLLADTALEKMGQHLGFDLHVLRRHGLPLAGRLRDTMVASYLRNPDARHGLDALAAEFLNHQMVPIEALIGRGRDQISMATVPAERVSPYACEDVDAVVRLWPCLAERLRENDVWRLFEEVEMPLVPVLVSMEEAGIAVDAAFLGGLAVGLGADMERHEREIYRIAGEEFNVNSPKQLQGILFEKLKMKSKRRTKTGFSTSHEVLEDLAVDHPLPREVLDYRRLAKLRSTYVEALPRMIDPQTGRIHARFHQTVTATGRLSSSNPNLQNIPIRTARGREIRRAFVARPGFRLLSADYSQIELRILAHLSEDEYLCAAFRQGADIHRSTAARIFGVSEEAVDGLMRARAKTVNFGVIYGMGAQRLARELRIPVKEAARFISEYYEKLPGMKAYMDRSVADARARGYARTLLGRRRLLPGLQSSHPRDRTAAERMAVNTPVQGSAADLIKLAMVRLHESLAREYPQARMLLQVHDELIFEVPVRDVAAVAERVKKEMESVMELRVPLAVETGAGGTWYEAHA